MVRSWATRWTLRLRAHAHIQQEAADAFQGCSACSPRPGTLHLRVGPDARTEAPWGSGGAALSDVTWPPSSARGSCVVFGVWGVPQLLGGHGSQERTGSPCPEEGRQRSSLHRRLRAGQCFPGGQRMGVSAPWLMNACTELRARAAEGCRCPQSCPPSAEAQLLRGEPVLLLYSDTPAVRPQLPLGVSARGPRSFPHYRPCPARTPQNDDPTWGTHMTR